MTRALVFLAALLAPVAALAQVQNCAPRELVVARLVSTYGETRRAMGINTQNVLVEIWASDETGSWTILLTTPQGRTCLAASGGAYEAVVPVPGEPG